MRQFIQELLRQRKLAKMRPREVAIFNVSGNYGYYQIKIGPVNEKTHRRAIEIHGKIHHLFVKKDKVGPLPTHEDVNSNMRGTVIMRDITVHLFDEKGDGHAVKIERLDTDGVHPHDLINLAGEDGEKLLVRVGSDAHIANETYHIIQEDILKALS